MKQSKKVGKKEKETKKVKKERERKQDITAKLQVLQRSMERCMDYKKEQTIAGPHE